MFKEHQSSCSLHSGPARWPMPCDCSKGGKQSYQAWNRWDYTPSLRLRSFVQLWQARLLWKHENHATLVGFLRLAKHSMLGRRPSRIQEDAAQPFLLNCCTSELKADDFE